ncbi:hypothetical protein COCNU_scaffold019717G000020 [Cocos nucifera]|nr:hypothetical protein [Cocos nucifera]
MGIKRSTKFGSNELKTGGNDKEMYGVLTTHGIWIGFLCHQGSGSNISGSWCVNGLKMERNL